MKFTFFSALILAVACTSCNNATQPVTETPVTTDTLKVVKENTPVASTVCYASTGNNTVNLKLLINGSSVTGNLLYNLKEKDSNKGDLTGTLKGDTLLADYNFMSEGVQSTRQVIYLLKDNAAIEGYGDVEEKNGKMIFKNTSTVTFGKGVKLQKVNCEK